MKPIAELTAKLLPTYSKSEQPQTNYPQRHGSGGITATREKSDTEKFFCLEMAAIFGEAWRHKDELQVGAYFAAFREAGLSVGKIKRGLSKCRTEWQGDFPPKPGQFVGLCQQKKDTPPNWQAYTTPKAPCSHCGRETEHVNTYAAGGYLVALKCVVCGSSTMTLPKPKRLPPAGAFDKLRSALK